MRSTLDLYGLLPAHHRRLDEERGFPLRALLTVVAEQGDVVRHGFDSLWDDLFIETCDRWAIPYIGHLVANRALDGGTRPSAAGARSLFRDLLGSPEGGPELAPRPAIRLRTDVAKTISYRRRKGTPAMLEELARDVTGWGAKVAEMFQLLEWTQNDDHVRLGRAGRPFPGSVDVRAVEAVDRVDGPFDRWAHSVDVRRVEQHEGWHNIANVAVFLWRLGSYPLQRVTPQPLDAHDAGEWRFHLSPLGNPAPLFVNPRPFPDERLPGVARVGELQVAAPVRRALFADDLERYRTGKARPRPARTELYGPLGDDGHVLAGRDSGRARSIEVHLGGAAVPPVADPEADEEDFPVHRRVVCRRLDPWPPRPTGPVIALDPVSGRLALGTGIDPDADGPVEVSYAYGFSADLGGGPYERRAWLAAPDSGTVEHTVGADPAAGADSPDLVTALMTWAAAPDRQRWVITILDSRTYALPSAVTLPAGSSLVVQAANQQRPLLRPTSGTVLTIDSQETTGAPEVAATLTLSGVVLEAQLLLEGEIRRLRLLHSTLVPGLALDPVDGAPLHIQPSVVVTAHDGSGAAMNTRLRLEMAFSISGGLRLPRHAEGMWLSDSIVDGLRSGDPDPAIAGSGAPETPAPPGTLERVTILGRAVFHRLRLADAVIFASPVTCERTQEGCVRFSWVPAGSTTPARFRCQPDEALREAEAAAAGALPGGERAQIRRRLAPRFTAVRYGKPGYGQLSLGAAAQIRAGAEDGSEMGAFAHLQQPQREANLRIRLDEYLPFGLTPGLIHVT